MTSEQAQAIRDLLVQVIEQESAGTRRVLGAVPEGNRDYRPDPKSRTAWELATHLATADVWFLDSIAAGKFEWPSNELPREMTDTASVASWYSRHLGESLARVTALTADQLMRPVQFARTTKPAVHWLTLMNNHSMHHRGQLIAYLRAAGSRVPAVYGASADENLFDG